jgi:hypothetical protein
MTDERLILEIEKAFKKAPDDLWRRIKKDIAQSIADDLLAKLDAQKAPCKKENLDHIDNLIALYMPTRFLEGA